MYRYFFVFIGLISLIALSSCQPATSGAIPVSTNIDQPALHQAPTDTAALEATSVVVVTQEVASEPVPTLESTPTPIEDVTSEAAVGSIGADSANTTSSEDSSGSTEVSKPAQPVPTQDPDCEDQAVFIKDVTVPDGTFFDPGAKFTKTWQVKNSGTCTWNGYTLVFAQGDMLNGPLTSPLPPAAPGEVIDITLELTAPQRTGLQTGNWIFQNAAGERFGIGVPSTGMVWAQIQIDSFPAPVASNPSGKGATVTVANPAPSGNGSVSSGCQAQENPAAAGEILGYVNTARADNGLSSLELQSQLSSAALVHSRDMACVGFVDHDGSDGSTWYDRVSTQGFANSASARENIYVGDPAFGGSPQGAFTWWMNSQVHRDNILNPNLSQVGIAYVYLRGSPYGGYYTMVLARP
jgi:uncharacterized protein YkwD